VLVVGSVPRVRVSAARRTMIALAARLVVLVLGRIALMRVMVVLAHW
jgi:hypothetical protein